MRIKDAINKVLWSEDKSNFTLVIRDRVKGSVEIPFNRIQRVDNNYVYLDDDEVIPVHRVLEIRKGKEIYWSRY
mgnify:CR=1 FL=1